MIFLCVPLRLCARLLIGVCIFVAFVFDELNSYSLGELKFSSSQPTLSYRVGVFKKRVFVGRAFIYQHDTARTHYDCFDHESLESLEYTYKSLRLHVTLRRPSFRLRYRYRTAIGCPSPKLRFFHRVKDAFTSSSAAKGSQ